MVLIMSASFTKPGRKEGDGLQSSKVHDIVVIIFAQTVLRGVKMGYEWIWGKTRIV